MALILKNDLYGNIRIDSNRIIGVMGNNYAKFIHMIKGNNFFLIFKADEFYTNKVDNEISLYFKNKENIKGNIEIVLNEFNLDNSFLNKSINDLSNGEKKLLKYILAFISNNKIIIIDEPYLDLDYNLKKKIKSLLQRIIYETDKTIIIGSSDSNVIYELCSSVLLLDRTYCYDKTINIFSNKEILSKYHIDIPEIVQFVDLMKEKNILIDYSYDIRDLIKDVYKCV